jgi:hypothetical protein
MAEEEQKPDVLAQIMHTHPVQVYFNHFVNNIGPGDITSILMRNGAPVCVLNMSATTAKTFAKFLTDAVAELEKYTGQAIVLAPDVLDKMEAGGRKA